MLEDDRYAGEISWRDRRGYNASSHRPDLVARPSLAGVAIEVELAKKSTERLRAVLSRYAVWRYARGSAVMYICADDEICQRVRTVGADVGITIDDAWLRVDLLQTIKAQAYADYEAAKSGRLSNPSAAPGPCLRSMAADKRKPKKKAKRRPGVETGEPIKDPGPPYVVAWHPEAVNERIESWPAEEKVAMLHAAQKLEAAGPRLGHPHSSAVRGKLGQGFRELRPRAGRSRWCPM